MNTMYFVLMSVVLTFVTGFFVAAIIWGISWFLSPKDERQFFGWHLVFFRNNENRTLSASIAGQSNDSNIEDSEFNHELYNYHHGEN